MSKHEVIVYWSEEDGCFVGETAGTAGVHG